MNRPLLTFALLAVLLPALAWGQPPALLSTWTTHGVYRLGAPHHLAVDAAGNVYVADPGELRVFAFTGDGAPLTSWTCPAIPALDFAPFGVAVSSTGRVYVTTPYPNGHAPFWVTVYTTAGEYLGPVGTMGSDPGQLGQSFDVGVDGSGNLYVMDWTNFRVDALTSGGGYVTQWGSYGSGPGQFKGPLAIAVGPDGLVYTTDDLNQRVQVFTKTGDFVTQWGSYGYGVPGQFAGPWGIAVDASGNVYVADVMNFRIQVFTASGQFVTQWGTHGSGPGQFNRAYGVAVAPDGRIYVADTFNGRIQVFAPLPRDVRVDLRPGEASDAVNPGAPGVLPVAILSESHFDATTVDPLSVRFAGATVRVRPNGEPMAWSRDVDGDGRLDLLLHMEAGALTLTSGDTVALLTAQAPHEQLIRGSAHVRVVGGPSHPTKPHVQPVASGPDAAPSLVRARILPQGGVVAFVRLAASGPARLDLLDVTGRRLGAAVLDGGSVNGREYELGPRNLSPGIYWVRLQQGGHVYTARVAAVR